MARGGDVWKSSGISFYKGVFSPLPLGPRNKGPRERGGQRGRAKVRIGIVPKFSQCVLFEHVAQAGEF